MPGPDPNLPPLPGQEDNSQQHGMAIIKAALEVAIANQARHEVADLHPLDLDRLVAASATLELAIARLTQACVDAQVASQARWS